MRAYGELVGDMRQRIQDFSQKILRLLGELDEISEY
jgi:hypothetical protein